MSALPQPTLSIDDFIAWENAQPGRHEYWRGEVFAMVGARRVHGTVVANVAREFGNALKGSPCRVFSEGMKLQVGDDALFYPDVFVTCDRADLSTEQIFRAPTLIVEVLSPTTRDFDRGLKFDAYRRIASLREYVVIDPDARTIQAWRVNAHGRWELYEASAGAPLEVPSLGFAVPAAEVFDGVDAPAA